MIGKSLLIMLAAAAWLASAGVAEAANPAYRVPEKVEYKEKCCQDLAAIAKKYNIEGIFSRDFEEGKNCLTRVELAAALDLVNEKLAEKVVREGGTAVAKADLDVLAEIREELRAEMLLVGTRTFQQRNELLGTLLHPLTKTISLSGQLVGVFQSTAGYKNAGVKQNDHSAFNGRGDLVFNFRVGENTIAVIDLDALLGNGIDPKAPSYSGLNGVADNTDARARFRQAWVETTMFDEKLVATIGKIDLANYVDANGIANDENSQFLSPAFVNAHILGVPDKTPGARLSAKLGEPAQLTLAYGGGDSTGDEFLQHGFGVAELDCKLKFWDLEGNYRVYGAIDGTLPDGSIKIEQKNAYNAGISIDQQLTDKLTLFGRFGQRDRNAYTTSRSWSAGLQYVGLIPGRADDTLGFAFGQISGKNLPGQEKLAEWYYRVKVNDKISISPIVQYLINPEGQKDQDNVVALGLRALVSF